MVGPLLLATSLQRKHKGAFIGRLLSLRGRSSVGSRGRVSLALIAGVDFEIKPSCATNVRGVPAGALLVSSEGHEIVLVVVYVDLKNAGTSEGLIASFPGNAPLSALNREGFCLLDAAALPCFRGCQSVAFAAGAAPVRSAAVRSQSASPACMSASGILEVFRISLMSGVWAFLTSPTKTVPPCVLLLISSLMAA